jgi:hypothetical protein
MNIEALIEKLASLRDEKAQLEKQVKELGESYRLYKQELLNQLLEQGLSTAASSNYRIAITNKPVTRLVDWDAFLEYVKSNDAYYLVKRGIASTKVYELETVTGEPIPGTETLTDIKDISLTKKA